MKRVLLIILTAALTVSCYLSELSNTTHPDMGMVVVNKIMPDGVTPPADGYTIVFNGQTYTTYTTTTTIDAVLEPGVYVLYVYNNISDMSIDHDVDIYGEGTITSSKIVDSGVVESLSGDLYFGTETITVLADEIVYSDVLLILETRDISFNLEITSGDLESIVEVSATLSGIAGQWECIEDLPTGDGVKIEPTLTLGESLTKASTGLGDHLTGTIKVLGIDPDDSQLLDITITLSDGSQQHFTKDVSSQLLGSNDTKATTVILSESIEIAASDSTDSSFDGDITDWEDSGNDSTFDAEQK